MFAVRLRRACTGLCVVLGAALMAAGLAAASPLAQGYRFPVAGPDGRAIALYAEERGQGAPVVLLHGLGGSTYSWRFVAPLLAQTHRTIALDLKGFGNSDKVFDRRYSAADQAQLIADFLIRRGLSNVTLVGHSFGGVVSLLTAIELKRRAPGLVRQLVLIDTPALPQDLTPVVALMQQPVLPYALLTLVPPDILTAAIMSPSAGERFERPYTPGDAHAYAAPFYDAAARHAYIQTSRQISPALTVQQLAAAYSRVNQRTLVLWCAGDTVVPLETGRRLTAMLPRARLELLQGCNHSPPDEAPGALTAHLSRFLADTAR